MNVYPCGIIVNPWASWLTASPDRKVYLPNRQPPIGILEMKCPRVSSVLETSYLQREGDHLVLRISHGYYTQILTQLAVTGLEWCDFFVWCLNDDLMETIHFDPLAWQEIKNKADKFFFMCDGGQLLADSHRHRYYCDRFFTSAGPVIRAITTQQQSESIFNKARDEYCSK